MRQVLIGRTRKVGDSHYALSVRLDHVLCGTMGETTAQTLHN